MNEFDDMANAAKRESEKRVADHAAELERRRSDEANRYRRDRELLMREVRPVMEQAAQAFVRTGVQCFVANPEAEDEPRRQNPTLKFQCRGQKTSIPQTGGSYTPMGVPVEVSSENGDISVRVGRTNNDRAASERISGEWPDALRQALKKALDSYHAHVEEITTHFS